MTNEYIDGHFSDIVIHGSDIESRGDDSDCTVRWIKEANNELLNMLNELTFSDEETKMAVDELMKVIKEV